MHARDTTHAQRIEMIELKLRGMSLRQIALEQGLHRDTVRQWWREYRDHGWEALAPKPRRRPEKGRLSTFDPVVRYVALRLKKEHPHWGPDLLLLHMRQRASLRSMKLPSRSSLAAYLHPYLGRIRRHEKIITQRPGQVSYYPRKLHEVWQMDFKGRESVGRYGHVVPFLVTEGLTSAPLAVIVHPDIRRGRSFRNVQANLRRVFVRWGLPDFIRMDRDPVFIGSGSLEWPGTLLLWLVGLGITPIVNAPFMPTQNARVERQGRTWKDHVAVGANYSSLEEVQRASEKAWDDRLIHLPSRNPACNGRPPLTAHPELNLPRRAFSLKLERQLFDFERVELYLTEWRWLRRVDKNGRFSISHNNILFGKDFYRQTVSITYDLESHAFLAQGLNEYHHVTRLFNVNFVAPEYILGLS